MFFIKKKVEPDAKAAPQGPVSPYMAARMEWEERYGSFIGRAAQWRFFALTCLGLLALSLCGNVLQVSQASVVPYFIEVDTLGRATSTRVENPGAPPRALVQAELANVVINWRTVTADADLQQRMIDRLSMFTTGSARGVVREWYAANQPYERAKAGNLVQVTIKGLPLPVSVDSWRVEWTETTRTHQGTVVSVDAYHATLRVQLQPPTTDQQIMINPGGVYISELNFSTVMQTQK